MAHGLAFWSSEACNVTNNWLGDVLADVRSSALFSIATDFTDHHDCIGVRVILECLKRIDMRGANDWVATDTNTG